MSASEWVVTTIGALIEEQFNSFAGTHATLPDGFTVSKDGKFAMAVDDEDFRGVKESATATGGCYAWVLGGDNHALGYQPTEDEFTAGFFAAQISNATGRIVREMTVSYDIICRNNENRSTGMDLQYSRDGVSYETVAGMGFVSVEAEDSSPTWQTQPRSIRIKLSPVLSAGQCIFLRWSSDDVGGAGSRDEIGIDDVGIIFHRPRGTVIYIQ